MSALVFQEIAQQFTTPIPDQFILEKMPEANGTYVKVFLYVFNGYYRRVPGFGLDTAAKALHILESEVIEALRYWHDQKVLDLVYNEKEDRYSLSFAQPSELPAPEGPDKTSKKQSAAADPSAPSKIIKVEQPPVYSPEEMTFLSRNSKAREMFVKAEAMLGKSGYMIRNKVYCFYDYYHLSVETVLHLIKYCTERGTFDLRAIERVALYWSENQIKEIEAAKQFTVFWSSLYELLQMRDQVPTEDHFRRSTLWMNEWHMNSDLIFEAASRSIGADAPFSYMDSILRRWNQNGVSDMAGVQSEDEKHASRTGRTANKSAARKVNNEYQLTNDYDYDKILADHKRRLYETYDQPNHRAKEN